TASHTLANDDKAVRNRRKTDYELRTRCRCYRVSSRRSKVKFGHVSPPATAPYRTPASETTSCFAQIPAHAWRDRVRQASRARHISTRSAAARAGHLASWPNPQRALRCLAFQDRSQPATFEGN